MNFLNKFAVKSESQVYVSEPDFLKYFVTITCYSPTNIHTHGVIPRPT